MHVAMVAPPWFRIPPAKYGGLERVVFHLVESLVDRDIGVTLLAPLGSSTRAPLIPISSGEAGLDMSEEAKREIAEAAGKRAYAAVMELDAHIIHDHPDHVFLDARPGPVVRTIHGPATEEFVERYTRTTRRGDRFIAISHRQRELFEQAARERFGPGCHIAIAGVIYNRIDVVNTPFYPADEKQDYALFVGRCHWEKGPAEAIKLATRAGIPMKMAVRISELEGPIAKATSRRSWARAGGLSSLKVKRAAGRLPTTSGEPGRWSSPPSGKSRSA